MNEFEPKNIFKGIFKTASVGILGVVLGAVLFIGLFIYNILKDLPDVTSLREFKHPLATEVLSDEGKKIGEFTTERRYDVRFEAIPKYTTLAFIAAEDSSFYEHSGIDYQGILRAVFSNVLKGRYAQGGSTITQQVARRLLLVTRKKELTRKIREVVLALRMEKKLTKNEILHLYLDEIYLGHGSYGIGAAAQNYFHKKVENLTLAESALLAGLPQRPNDLDPFKRPQSAKTRQHYVLKRMVDEGFITDKESREALAQPLQLYSLEESNLKLGAYFIETVRQKLVERFGTDRVYGEGFKVYTTMRVDAQAAAEKAIQNGMREVDKRLGWRGVAQNLKTEDEIQKQLTQIHDLVLNKLTPVRILPATIEADTRRLAFDLNPFQKADSPYFGPTPVRESEYYPAVVMSVDSGRGLASAKIGDTLGTLAWAEMEWLKEGEKPFKSISEVLKKGDVIQVKVGRIDRRTGAIQLFLEQDPEIEGALLSYDLENGQVRAMVGGRDFQNTKFNIALQAKRQVGSTFKPVLYAAAMDKGYSPSSIVTDSPLVFKVEGDINADTGGEEWRPHNFGGTFEGDIPLRLALIRSMNVPTVKLLNEITVDYGIQYARKLGITAVLPRDLSIGLGSWSSSLEELTRAYAVFPRLGRPLNLTFIKKVVDASGKTIWENSPELTIKSPSNVEKTTSANNTGDLSDEGLVISPQTAYVMTDMLRGVIREGTGGRAAVVPGAIAGKTGTSNDHRDAWFVGYTPHLMTGVWLGYLKDKPLTSSETGGRAAAPIWAEYMQGLSGRYPKNDFPIPDDIVFAYVDKHTGALSSARSPGRVRVAFKSGTVPNETGDNLMRVGEPGARISAPLASPPTGTSETGEGLPSPVQDEGKTSDYLRQGYQE